MGRIDPTADRASTAVADERAARLKWVIGTPSFGQGTSNLAEIPTLYFSRISFGMGQGPARSRRALCRAGGARGPPLPYGE